MRGCFNGKISDLCDLIINLFINIVFLRKSAGLKRVWERFEFFRINIIFDIRGSKVGS